MFVSYLKIRVGNFVILIIDLYSGFFLGKRNIHGFVSAHIIFLLTCVDFVVEEVTLCSNLFSCFCYTTEG